MGLKQLNGDLIGQKIFNLFLFSNLWIEIFTV